MPSKALPCAKQRTEFGRAARAVVNRAFTPDRYIIKCIPKLCRRAEVLHGQKIVRRIKHRRSVPENRVRRPGARRGKRRSAGEHLFQLFRKLRCVECRRRLFECGKVTALAAEGERVNNPGRAEKSHAAAGKPFGRGKAPRQRQFEHERHAAAHRAFRAGEFIIRGRLAALHEVAGHYRHNGCIRPADFANFSYLILVPAVKRVVFRNDADRFHENPSFFLLRFGEKNAKIGICETMIP